ncbi:hypothetical protein QUF75_15035 [Desulfococcaceae bacterium HSG7]|nr:hypothetical protein [Desulfococcaceae bacterium HSG7]
MKCKKIVILGLIAVVVLFHTGAVLGEDCIRVNQSSNAGKWNFMGLYKFGGTPATVTITRENDGTSTCADAVKFVNVTTGTEYIVDNEGGGGTFSKTGSWTDSAGDDGWDPDIPGFSTKDSQKHSLYSDSVGDVATWSSNLPAGTYNFFASWTDAGTRASKAPYCIDGYSESIIGVTSSAGTGGTIAPSGFTTYDAGDTPDYTITPNTDYVIYNVLVNGKSVYDDLVFSDGDATASATYTFPALDRAHII